MFPFSPDNTVLYLPVRVNCTA